MPFFTTVNQPNQVVFNSQGAVVQFVENSLCSHFPLILCHHPWAGTWHFWRGGECGGVADFEEYLPLRGVGWQKEDLSPFWDPKVAENQLGIPGEAGRRRRR